MSGASPRAVAQIAPAARITPIPLGMPLEDGERRLTEATRAADEGQHRRRATEDLAAKRLGMAGRTIYRKLKEGEGPEPGDPT